MNKINKRPSSSEKERWQYVKGLSRQFIQRWDLYARKVDDGRYLCLYQAFNYGLMYRHLQGKITLGSYLLDKDSQARYTVLDADTNEDLQTLQKVYLDLKRQNIPGYLEASRRGGHLWLFFGEPIPGEKARGFGRGIAKAYGLEAIEVFPKQAVLADGPGSLIRMPFGIHRKTGQRYGFITPDGEPIGNPRYQLNALSRPDTVPNEAIEIFQYHEPEHRIHFTGRHNEFKDVLLLDFLSQYVELRPTASGAIGFCPFHDDQQPSFGVNAKGNYWNCFAGCGGGDIVSFWMRFKNLDYPNALKDLEEVLYGHTNG